jgi:membrane protease YdiL (CAAX protease family)
MIAYVLIAIMVSALFVTTNINVDGMQSVNITEFVSLKTIGYISITLIFMCLTTFIQGIIQSVMSAKTTNIQEAGNATIFLVTLNLILYTIVTILVSPLKTSSVISYIISVIPIASMYFIPAMFVIGQANIVQIILALIILIASIPLSLIVAQKPFKNAILDYSSKKDKKIEGIEKIIVTKEYQQRMIERKESSKKGLIIGLSVILLIILQVVGGLIISLISNSISQKITFISKDNIYLILTCIVFIISIYLPYLILKAYLPKNDEVDNKSKEKSKEERKSSIINSVKYIVLSIPFISVIQMICSFAIEKIGITSDITDAMGLFNYSGKLSTILLFLEIAILPAIFEELFIRKGVYGIIRDKGVIFASIVSAVIFATIHMNFSQFIFAFLIGILFAIVREKTGKLYPTMILHLLNNGFAVIDALFYDHMTFMQIFTYIQIALNAVGFCILIYMLYKKFMELKDKESIQRLKEKLDYRKIKLNLIENVYVFKDYTFFVAEILAIVMFIVIERII